MGYIQKLSQNNIRLVCGLFRAFGTSSQVLTSHYDILGITPSATQRDIKSAYYNLSKLYHPDISSDDESAKKFRAITEAYEVLGNINLKKMYDKGLMVGRDNTKMQYKPDVEPTDPSLKFYKSRTSRHVTPTIDGRTPIYDFDTWSKEHYGDILKKNQRAKKIINTKKENVGLRSQAFSQELLVYFITFVSFLFIGFAAYGTTDYDHNKIENNKVNVKSNSV